ncbi:MAG: S41 family peptidase [bacterium]|nr:S41 family peptidase [bacterium]
MGNNVRLIKISVMFFCFTTAAFLFGVYVGHDNRPEVQKILSLTNTEGPFPFEKDLVDFSPFWKTWNTINEKFVSTASTTADQEKVWGAIGGLVDSLNDPYSVFLPPQESETFAENISGNFGGVGMEIGVEEGILTVIAPLKNTPAEKAGILSRDKILKIDEAETTKMRVDEAVRLIRGPIGTEVSLTIKRVGVEKPFEIKIKRDVITIPTIDTEKLPEGVFLIKFYNFSGNSPQLFREALRDFVLSGMDKLIIDIRGNVGGFLEAAVDVTSWFLPAGKVIVTEDFGSSKDDIVYRSRGYNVFNENLKLILLIDGGSASASEIFAGALSEHGIAKLVGGKTFGKGSVQELINITGDTSLKITVANWLTPNGKSFSGNGIVPDYEVSLTPKDKETGKDPQLEKAIEILNEEL